MTMNTEIEDVKKDLALAYHEFKYADCEMDKIVAKGNISSLSFELETLKEQEEDVRIWFQHGK